MCGYIEDENGDPVDEQTVEGIRELARAIWAHLALVGRAPLKWTEIGIESKLFYLHTIYRIYPFMALASNHWKAQRIATDYYPSWTSSRKDQIIANLQLPALIAAQVRALQVNPSVVPAIKRSASEDPEDHPNKKPKKELKSASVPKLKGKAVGTMPLSTTGSLQASQKVCH